MGRRPGSWLLVIALAATLAASTRAASTAKEPPRFRLRELPTLGDASLWAFPHDINASGVVSGMAHAPGDGNRWWAVRWVDGVIERLAPLADADLCWGLGINDRGDVSGACRTPKHPAGQAMLWLANGSALPLDSIDGLDAFASNVNNDGVAAGHISGDVSERRPAIWTRSTLVTLEQSGGVDETVFDINDRGQAVGFGRRGDGTLYGVLWNHRTPKIFAEDAMGLAINRNGDIAGRSKTSWIVGNELFTAVAPTVWIGGARRVLMNGPGDMVDINDAGWAVGYHVVDANGGEKAILFDGSAVHDLLSLVDGPNRFTSLMEARAINNSGQIVAWASVGSETRAVVLTPITAGDKRLHLDGEPYAR